MYMKPALSSADAARIAATAQTFAEERQWKVSIVVVDDGGHPLCMTRLDGATPSSAYIAQAKANTAALGRRESKGYEDMINNGRTAFLSVPRLEGMLEGGVPIIVDGHCLGAVGVSGVKASDDALIASAGIAALDGTAR